MEHYSRPPWQGNGTNQQSEVAHLRARIEQEHAASVWALTGLAAGTARHWFIQRRLERMDSAHGRLSTLIGEEQATAFLCELFEKTPEKM